MHIIVDSVFTLFYIRYLSRVVLVPFPHHAGEVTLDEMHVLLSNAVAAFPWALRLGHYMETCTVAELYSVRDVVHDAVGCVFDSRLATQYAFSLACVQKVKCCLPHVYREWT